MKQSVRIAAICLLVSTLLLSPVLAAETVKLATLDWEPYIGQNLEGQGFVAAIIREAFKRSGYEVSFEFMPWARVVKMASEGQYDGYAPEYYSEEVKAHSVFSDAFPGGPLGFFAKKDKNITYSKLEDLAPLTIGVVRGYVNTAEFDAAAYLKKEEAADDLTNLKKLSKDRLDLVVIDKYVGAYLIQTEMPDQKDALCFVYPPLEEKELFVAFSKKAPGHEAKLKAFNEGLQQIKDDGTLQAIMTKYGF